ncbi:MAG: sulfotransferase family protein [Planctomycetota bacterium]|jgi:hypothetical protein|nr:sulfotransferase family protein [Planctomycetota bacterium]
MNQSGRGDPEAVVIVSGVPRSGTSLLMNLLEAGGVFPLTDGVRSADEDNPRGYYEYEPVKQMAEERSWIPDARGRSLKVITRLLRFLPSQERYLVLFMRRHLEEILDSQEVMLRRRGIEEEGVSRSQMMVAFDREIEETLGWIDVQPNMKKLEVNYNRLMEDAATELGRIQEFLGRELDRAAMLERIDPDLYRQRRSG